MSAQVQNHIAGRLSLRPPQAESLARLISALQAAPEMLQKQRSLDAVLATLKVQFASLEDFEREFPSLCFALATGVGKTRLMGAFIAYLHLAHGINNFFVLAPNLTIYNKLIGDFTPNSPKYVFKGIAEFAVNTPRVITGDNYDQSGLDITSDIFSEVRINIFNIAKINSEVRGGKEPRIKRMKEVLGDSYFNYLASLPDLVLLMDESHRYRAQAGMRSINELNPLFGLELTATPFTESTRGPVPFKNVVMDYPLASAMADGFVKEPAAVTQRNYDASAHSAEEVEAIKLQDGIRVHESTKAELLTYARENSMPVVKPFMLVIARDTTHAAALLALIESNDFYEGRYQGKVIQVDSSRSGADEEQMIARLLAVESVDEPTEIVIHVNMLKEGWDVTNLYTIVPLRAANARTLIEQSIGRGLRLPYGKRTGVEAVDRLNIVAHDKFEEIIREANRGDSPIRMQQLILEAPGTEDRKQSIQVLSSLRASFGLQVNGSYFPTPAPPPMFVNEPERQAAQAVLDVVRRMETEPGQVPNSRALLEPKNQRRIVDEVIAHLRPAQAALLADAAQSLDVPALVAKATQALVQQSIDIPRIAIIPSGEVSSGFHAFTLDVSALNLKATDREILIHNLRTNEQTRMVAETEKQAIRLEDTIVHALLEFDDIDYPSQAELLYNLAAQAVKHFASYLASEQEVRQVLEANRRLIGNEIHSQMQAHFWQQASEYRVQVSRGFTELKDCNYTVLDSDQARDFRETLTDLGRIKQMLFGGFERCLYPFQKFDSDTERQFSCMLERDALKWFKPTKGQFQIYYRINNEQSEYVPDFVVETESQILMVETKARNEVEADDVIAKATAAKLWCQHASDYCAQSGGKPWRYLLIPHNEVLASKRLQDYLRFDTTH